VELAIASRFYFGIYVTPLTGDVRLRMIENERRINQVASSKEMIVIAAKSYSLNALPLAKLNSLGEALK